MVMIGTRVILMEVFVLILQGIVISTMLPAAIEAILVSLVMCFANVFVEPTVLLMVRLMILIGSKSDPGRGGNR